MVLGCETRVRRGQRFRESVGESEVPHATPVTADVSKTHMVPLVEHSVGLQRCSVLRPLASGAPCSTTVVLEESGQECRDV